MAYCGLLLTNSGMGLRQSVTNTQWYGATVVCCYQTRQWLPVLWGYGSL